MVRSYCSASYLNWNNYFYGNALLLKEAMHLYRRRPYLSTQAYRHAVETIKAASTVLLNLETTNPIVKQQQAQHIKHAEDMWAFLDMDSGLS
jgi:hypothetical protein